MKTSSLHSANVQNAVCEFSLGGQHLATADMLLHSEQSFTEADRPYVLPLELKLRNIDWKQFRLLLTDVFSIVKNREQTKVSYDLNVESNCSFDANFWFLR